MRFWKLQLAILAAGAATASARTITFEGFTIGSVPGNTLEVMEAGVLVRINAPRLTVRDFDLPPFPHTTLIHPGDFTSPTTIDLTPGVRGLVFENYIRGFYTPEVDVFRVVAYDASNNIVDVFNGPGQFISVTAGTGEGDITRVVIDDAAVNDQETGYQIDNIELRTIPAPATLLALAPLAALRRRR